jgi:uncharacterized membrane protein
VKTQRKWMVAVVLTLALFLLGLPVSAQEGSVTDPSNLAGLPTGWMWGVMLFLMLVILILIGVILYLVREQAKAGNKQAIDLLKGFEAARDVIPIDKIRILLQQLERRADASPNPWDDIAVGGIQKGVDMILQRNTTETVTAGPGVDVTPEYQAQAGSAG